MGGGFQPLTPDFDINIHTYICIYTRTSIDRQDGLHGQGSRFMSITQLKGDELMPRIVQIAGARLRVSCLLPVLLALTPPPRIIHTSTHPFSPPPPTPQFSKTGVYPGLTAQELLAPASTEAPAYGMWAYDFSDPEGPQMGTVALPASALVHACIDPVVVIASNDALNIDMRGDHDVEVRECLNAGVFSVCGRGSLRFGSFLLPCCVQTPPRPFPPTIDTSSTYTPLSNPPKTGAGADRPGGPLLPEQ